MSDQHSQEFWDYANKMLNDEGLNRKIRDISSEEEVIEAVKFVFNWTPSALKDNIELKKSSANSMKYAEEAIKAANNREVGRSLKLANMITAFAEDAGDLALGHSIRFQIFDTLKINFYEMIEELELCLKIPQPLKKMNAKIKLKSKTGQMLSPNLSKKELTRFLKEFQRESKLSGVKEFYEDKGQQKQKKRKFTRELFTLKNPNPKAPALEDFVEIKYNSVKGRSLVVTKGVPAGTTLIVEKPFICGLGNVFDLEINRCYNCFRGRIRPVPCPNCVFVLYCSKKCLEDSKEYHSKYECSVFPHLHSVLSSVDYHKFLCAYSTICTFGPRELFHAFEREQEQSTSKKSDADVIPGFDPETGIYDPFSFYTISHMAQRKDGRLQGDDAVIALGLTKILETCTDFFQQLELEPQLKSPKEMTQFQDFVTLALIKISDSFAVTRNTESKYFDAPDGWSSTWAFSTQPTNNLVSVSSDENSMRVITSNLKGLGCAGVALRDLKKGEKILISYRQSCTEKTIVAHFNDWPLMEKLEAEKDGPKFCCPPCSSKIPPEPKMLIKENYRKIALNSGTGTGNNLICPKCESEYKKEELMTQFKRHSKALDSAEKLIEKEECEEALESLKAASTFFQTHLIPPSYQQEKCQDFITSAIDTFVTDVYD